jgi:hypothetical protein
MAIEIFAVDKLLQEEFPPTDSLVGNGLIDKAGAILISGPQKIGKSLFGTQLALSLANRTPFIGFPVGDASYRTLILQAEVAPKRMKQRFEKQVSGFPPEAQQRVLSASVFSSVKLDSQEGVTQVMAWIGEYAPDLLIIDPLSNFHCGDENVAKDMLKITSVLDSIRQMGVAVALVHHHGKSSTEKANVGYKARGSSVIPGWYDSHFSLERNGSESKTVKLKFELRHDQPPEDKVLKLNPATLQFEEQIDEASQVALVVGVVEELGSATREQVAERCNRTPQWAGGFLRQAVTEGKLISTGNRPVTYSLPGTAPVTMQIPNPHGGAPIVISTNTGVGGGVQVDGQPWWEQS